MYLIEKLSVRGVAVLACMGIVCLIPAEGRKKKGGELAVLGSKAWAKFDLRE